MPVLSFRGRNGRFLAGSSTGLAQMPTVQNRFLPLLFHHLYLSHAEVRMAIINKLSLEQGIRGGGRVVSSRDRTWDASVAGDDA